MATFKSILTNKGLQLEAAAAASGVPMTLTHMAVGDGNGNPVTPNPAQTTLARERYRHAVNRLVQSPTDPTMYLAELIIPADTGGFVMREVGLYSSNGDLFAVGNLPDTYKPLAAEGSFGDSVIKMFFKVANTGTVTIVFDPNVVVATHSWVMNNVNASTIIPGGLTGQLLSKKSNADGDTEWIDVTEGITVIVSSREETQTLAAGQTIIDLAEITAEGAAVYIEGTRLRADEFSETGPTQITLASSHPAGTKATVVQNEEVGSTDVLQRPLNLSDVPDKNQARLNLELPNWLANSSINWTQLVNVPEYASRWASWSEVTGKPTSFPPSAHTHAWGDITGAPETATRWPTWGEVTSKPSLFPPSAHTHAEYVQKVGDAMTGLLTVPRIGINGGTAAGAIVFDAIVSASGRVLMRDVGNGTPVIDFVNQANSAWRDGVIRASGYTVTVDSASLSATGSFSASGNISSSANIFFNQNLISSTANVVIAPGSNGYVYQRPRGVASATGQAYTTSDGNFTTNPVAPNPGSSVGTFGFVSIGSYGGGFGMIDGSYNIGLWSNTGTLNFGFGSNNGAMTSRATLSATGAFTPTGGYDFGSSIKLKDIEGPVPYGLAAVEHMELASGRYKPEYNDDGRRRLFFVAEQLAELVPEAVDLEGVEFNGERVASIKLDQLLPVMAKAIQELAARVRELEAR